MRSTTINSKQNKTFFLNQLKCIKHNYPKHTPKTCVGPVIASHFKDLMLLFHATLPGNTMNPQVLSLYGSVTKCPTPKPSMYTTLIWVKGRVKKKYRKKFKKLLRRRSEYPYTPRLWSGVAYTTNTNFLSQEGNIARLNTQVSDKNKGVFVSKYFTFLNKFLLNFFQFLFNQKLHITFKKLWWQGQYLEQTSSYKNIILKIRKSTRKLKAFRMINNFYKVLWVSMRLKDSNFFLKWFCYRVELLFFKLHKNVPYLLNIIFKQFSKLLFKQTKTQGVFFSLRGKISVTGDAKKRHVYVKYGKHSSSTKNLSLSISKAQIKTKTGVMGVTFGIFF